MAIRTTSNAVSAIIEVDSTISLTPFIEAANALVTECCSANDYDGTRLELNRMNNKVRKQSKEWIANRVASRLKNNKKWTEEMRQNHSKIQKERFQHTGPNKTFGIVPSKKTRELLSKAHKGHITSEETRAKISKALKGHPGANKGGHLSECHKEKLRIAAKKRIQAGKHNNERGRNGWFYSRKNRKKLHYRSHLERDWYRLLEKLPNVEKYKAEPVSISYFWKGSIHTYIPDLLVYFKNGCIDLLEIKPEYAWNSLQNKAKFEAAEKWCKRKQKIRQFKIFGYDKLRRLA